MSNENDRKRGRERNGRKEGKRTHMKEVRQKSNGGREAKERRREAPMATLSQQRPQRVTVRQTDRTPPKVTNASIYQTHKQGPW